MLIFNNQWNRKLQRGPGAAMEKRRNREDEVEEMRLQAIIRRDKVTLHKGIPDL